MIKLQEELGLDVLVHGEAERNDMVEYFGEQLDGFAFTETAGCRVLRFALRQAADPLRRRVAAEPDDGRWTEYAQSLTDRPMKGMLTGPVTILQWSFVRDDQPRAKPRFRSRWRCGTRCRISRRPASA